MIELRSVTKRHRDGSVAVDNLSISIASGELCVLVGPSGCGKTTTLKMINRLIEPTSGQILIDDVDVLSLDPVQLRRGIGYVMQLGGLFPHRRVGDNVGVVPRLLGWPADKVAARVEELLALVGLEPSKYLRRFPHELSGGERQRVGVARALGADPPILLMDEPFGAVDPIARKRLQAEFFELQARLNKTVVFVTHDIEEALFLGHRIAILQNGAHIAQFDTPAAILARPATPFVSEFVGADRDLERLSVTELILADLEPIATATREATIAEIASNVAPGTKGIVVLSPDSVPLGYISVAGNEDPAATAASLMTPFAATVPLGSSLRTALIAMLQGDHLVAVTERGRFVGVVTFDGLQRSMQRVPADLADEE
jgi:osmoprotectant transport system ATP-binding protein